MSAFVQSEAGSPYSISQSMHHENDGLRRRHRGIPCGPKYHHSSGNTIRGWALPVASGDSQLRMTFDGQAIEGTDAVRMIDEGGGQP